MECLQTEGKNDDFIQLVAKEFKNIEVVRGGSVAIEAIGFSNVQRIR